jgi:hypothetical protein
LVVVVVVVVVVLPLVVVVVVLLLLAAAGAVVGAGLTSPAGVTLCRFVLVPGDAKQGVTEGMGPLGTFADCHAWEGKKSRYEVDGW